MENQTEASSTIHERLKTLRVDVLNLTQVQMSEVMQTTQGNISQIENGECLPSGNFIARLSINFPQINFNWLIYNVEKPTRVNMHGIVLEKKSFQELNKEISRLRKDNSRLIDFLDMKNKKKGAK